MMQNKRKRKGIAVALCLCVAMVLVLLIWGNAADSGDSTRPAALYLYGDLSEMESKKDVRSVSAAFEMGDQQITCYATIKLQGTSSLAYEKKNYTIKLYEDAEHEIDQNVDLGWGAEHTYCLKANWIDKTHSRNIVTAQLAAEIQSRYNIMEDAPCNGLIDGFPVAVYINDEFHGLYTWNIPKKEWMFGMDKDNPNHIVLGGEDWSDAACFKAEPDLTAWEIEVGPEDEETLSKFSRLVDFVINSTDEEFRENFEKYMDLDAALNYYVMVDFAYLPDNRGKNMLMATYDGELWYPSLYDMDTSWGTNWSGQELYDYENEVMEFGEFNRWAQRLVENFPQELHDRYFELRQQILTKEHVMNLFYTFEDQISDELWEAERQRWGDDIPGYDLTQIETYLDFRIPQLDEKYENLIP